MNEVNMYTLIFFVLALLTVVFFHISVNRRIDEISEKIIKWQSLQTEYNEIQTQINQETQTSFNDLNTAAQMLEEKINHLENDMQFHTHEFASLKKIVDDYTEILLDHAMK